jgi:AcrR family transcriptional regulator
MYDSQAVVVEGQMEDSEDLWPPFGRGYAQRDQHRVRRNRAVADRREGGRRAPRPAAPHRGRTRPGPPLSRADIVDAAIAIADSEGPDAVSMRKIAQLLRVGTMTLYWHVANKEHLLDLVLDTLVGQTAAPRPSGDWRADLQALARSQRSMLLAHKWVMEFIGGRPSLGPNTLLNLEGSLAALDGLGIDTAMSLNILAAVSTYVLGTVLRELRELRDQRDQERYDVDSGQWREAKMQWRRKLVADGRFEHFIKIIDENIDPDAPETRDDRFEFGLDCVLDGIAAQIARRAQHATG